MKKLRTCACAVLVLWALAFAAWALAPLTVDAESAVLVDPVSGTVLYAKNEHVPRPPASMTKMMTALLVLESGTRMDQTVTVSESAMEGMENLGSSVVIHAGEQLTVKQLLTLLLVASVNESANVCAELVSGDIPTFVEKMNARAEELGCTDTQFKNPHGLHEDGHLASAYDLYLIAKELQKYPEAREIYGLPRAELPATNKSDARTFFTTNSLISRYKERDYFYRYADGIKTGTTTQAGLCLTASAEKGGISLISVVMGAKRDANTNAKGNFTETRRMFEWGFGNFMKKTLLETAKPIAEVKVRLAWNRDYVTVAPAADYETLVPRDFDEAQLQTELQLPESIDAPVTAGDVIGSVVLRYGEIEYAKMDLVATDSLERSWLLTIWSWISGAFSSLPAKIIGAGILLFLIIFIAATIKINRKRKSKYRE